MCADPSADPNLRREATTQSALHADTAELLIELWAISAGILARRCARWHWWTPIVIARGPPVPSDGLALPSEWPRDLRRSAAACADDVGTVTTSRFRGDRGPAASNPPVSKSCCLKTQPSLPFEPPRLLRSES